MTFAIKRFLIYSTLLLLSVLLMNLGFWQLSRARQKENLLEQYALRAATLKTDPALLTQPEAWRFYRFELKGVYDNAHTFLLDNTIRKSVVGYEIYTPFKITSSPLLILIDRGFVPQLVNRQELPTIPPLQGVQIISGNIDLPPHYVAYGKMWDASLNLNHKKRAEYIDLKQLQRDWENPISPYVLHLVQKNAKDDTQPWQVTAIPPSRHRGYALQWFALALTLLVLSAAQFFRKKHALPYNK